MAFLSFLIVVALVVCHNPKQLPEEKSEELPVFNLEAVAEETVPSAFMWNDITEKATFIPLSSDEKTLLSGSLGITFMDNEYIVIVDYKTGSFYRYGVDGKVQRSFKYEGKTGIKLAFHVNTEDLDKACAIAKKTIKATPIGSVMYFQVTTK